MAKESFFSLRTLLEKEKLNADGSNFTDRFRNLTIVLRREKKEYVLNTPFPDEPKTDAKEDEVTKYAKHKEDELDVQSLLVGMMSSDLQRRFMDAKSYKICDQLKKIFQEQVRIERYQVIKSLLSHRMAEGSSITTHMLRMTIDIELLRKLNVLLSKEFATDVILNSLPPSYSGFIMNYHMHGMDKSLQELSGMLRTAGGDMKKGSNVLTIHKVGRKVQKAKAKKATKGKGKGKLVPKKNTSKAKVPSDAQCYYCNGKGHWKRNCPKYLADLKAGNVKPSTSSIFVIEINNLC